MIYIQLAASNDTNGNPRRVFVLFNDNGEIKEVIDEGYSGDPYANKEGYFFGGTFESTPRERQNLLREFKTRLEVQETLHRWSHFYWT